MKTKKKVFCPKISTNSIFRLKIHAIFHEFVSEDKKKGLQSKNFPNSGFRLKIIAIFHEFLVRPKTFMKSGVSLQKLRKFGR